MWFWPLTFSNNGFIFRQMSETQEKEQGQRIMRWWNLVNSKNLMGGTAYVRPKMLRYSYEKQKAETTKGESESRRVNGKRVTRA